MKNLTDGRGPSTEAPACRIELDLTRHCIQTAVRRRYEKLLAAYFKPRSERDALEPQIHLLQQALETLDFCALRSRWPVLAGGRAVAAGLCLEAGRIVITAEGLTMEAPLRETATRSPFE